MARRLLMTVTARDELAALHPRLPRRQAEALLATIEDLQKRPRRWPQALPGVRVLEAGEVRVLYAISPDTGDNDTAGDAVVLCILAPAAKDR